jgi:hypothetical protein
MTTVGGSREFALPPFGLEAPPREPNRSWPLLCGVAVDKFEGCPGWPSSPLMAPALPVKGFPRASLSVDVEDVGVRLGDWLEASRDEGEAVPSLESLFFLEDLLGSLPRDSY